MRQAIIGYKTKEILEQRLSQMGKHVNISASLVYRRAVRLNDP